MTTTVRTTADPKSPELLAKIDELFAKADHPDTPGAALGVVQDGELIVERYYGMADLENKVQVSADSVFDIASTSKQFTAACILLLHNRGELSLDDEIQNYVPELQQFEWPVTIRHLIHHTSGIRDQYGLTALSGRGESDVRDLHAILSLLALQRTLNFEPGTKHLYSNAGYVLLGIIVTRVSGESLADFAKANLLEPLGMSRSFFRDDPGVLVPGLVHGYTHVKGQYKKPHEGWDEVVGDGGLISCIHDLAKWDRNYIDEKIGGPGFTAAMEEIGTPEDSETKYAFGLEIGDLDGLRIVSHGGALTGFQGEFLRVPEQKLTVIVHANIGGFDSSGIARSVANLLLGNEKAEEAPAADTAADAPAEPGTPDKDLLGMYIHDETGMAFDIDLKDDELAVSVQDIYIPLKRKTGDRFITEHPVYSLDTDFANEDGKLVFRLYHAGEVLMKLDRVTPPVLSEADLDALVGEYSSDELETIYDVRAEEGQLFLWRKVAGRDKLRATLPDEFASSFGRIKFDRDVEGKVVGLTADTSRANDLKFTRVS